MTFLRRCHEFSCLLRVFNQNYALRAQKVIVDSGPLPDYDIEKLDTFQGEYNAFLREVEPWSERILAFIKSKAVVDENSMYQLAPSVYFERVPPFRKATPARA